jgi:transcriptional regulator with XRE-family HTH domain
MQSEPERYKVAISKIWRRVRISKQVSRVFVAESLGVSKSTIDKIEQGVYHIRLTDMVRFCEAIDYNPVEFMQQVVKELPSQRKK